MQNTAGKNPLDLVEAHPGIMLPQALAEHWPEIEKTGRKSISITATPNNNLSLQQSKFGHYPYLPMDFAYPTDRNGYYMYPLAQINFSECPSLAGFPDSGYLQFYISSDDDVFGLSFDEKIPSDIKVLFFRDEDIIEHKSDLSFLDAMLGSEQTPVFCPHSLKFEQKTDYIGPGDIHGEHSPYFNTEKVMAANKPIADHLSDAIYETFSPTGHKIGGYAFFTQNDPREYASDKKDFILLFQMDSDEQIMWGDVGVANFFIHPDKLAARDFSEVYYNWDCH